MPQTVRAAVIPGWGGAPEVHDLPVPQPAPGRSLVRLLAAAVNPVDLAIGSGRFYMPLPDPPFTAGVEAVGEVLQSETLPVGSHVWCLRPSAGCWAERFSAADDTLVPVDAQVDPALAVGMGVAGLAGWMPVVHRGGLQAGETVLVLGATGAVGQVALQAARARGAGRIVAVGRNPDALRHLRALGAHEVIGIAEADDLTAAIRAACPDGVDLVVDALWAAPLVASLPALSPRARVVQVGSAAGQTADLAAGPLRGKRIDIRGFSVFAESHDALAAAHTELVEAAAAGLVGLPIRRLSLDEVALAWAEQASGAGGDKLVLVP